MEERVTQLERELAELKALYYKDNFSDKEYFRKRVEFEREVRFGAGNTQFTTGQIGFFNATPVSQQSAITTPAGGATIDAESRTAIGQIKTALQNLGLTA